MVCMARAAAHGRTQVARFDDPTALTLLPAAARALVEEFRSGQAPHGLRQRGEFTFLRKRSEMMALRTVAIDDAVRGAASPQVVILGAGLDGRAWRMPELSRAVVFEVDHPDTQRTKRGRVGDLQRAARAVHFVAVDFTRDSLGDALAQAGHDASIPTTWIWEGVVMYLTLPQIEATLEVVRHRSASRSRLVIAYMQPAMTLTRLMIALAVRRVGEPLRAMFKPSKMRVLLAKYDFAVTSDDDLPTLALSLSASGKTSARRMDHLRIVTADRPA